MAPHIAEELWESAENPELNQGWPQFDESNLESQV